MGPLLPPAAAIMAAPSSRVVAALPLFNSAAKAALDQKMTVITEEE